MISFSGLISVLLILGVALGMGLALLLGVKFIAAFLGRIFAFIGGVVLDVFAFVGCLLGFLVSMPMAVCFLVIGRWQRANTFARWFGDSACGIVRHPLNAILVRPLRLIYLNGPADAIAEALPGAVVKRVPSVTETVEYEEFSGAANPGRLNRDPLKPFRNDDGTMNFPGFKIVGKLKPGGSGAKLYIARPDASRRARLEGQPFEVVIKSFMLEQGSTLPAIVRESRALESARSMGLVLEHHLDVEHFWYVMPYHDGDSLSTVVNREHHASSTRELRGEQLVDAVGHVRDLVVTLVHFHEAGLWHKDVKPDNLIVHDGRAHLVDLGLVTSLQSALTLTTHGTEYFRDPELVRMALRGVKVHEVDGSKFDIYGAGAVLYYVLENDFPAHGGLSDFSRKVPDALMWIVRRAMADYGKRYENSRNFLADLDTVLAADDIWSIRPAELPSMAEGVQESAPPPPPYARTTRVPPVLPVPRPVTGYFSRRGSFVWAAKRNVAAIKREKPVIRRRIAAIKREKPVIRRRVVAERPPVAADRPSALLFVIGIMALASIAWVMFLMIPFSSLNDETDWAAFATDTLGESATTVTLVAPGSFERILLVQDEDEHLRSGELAKAVDSIIAWYASREFIVDSKPDMDSLGLILSNGGLGEYMSEVPVEFGEALDSQGYSAIARVVEDKRGDIMLQIVTRSNQILNMPFDGDFEEVELWVPDAGLLPGQSMVGATLEFSISRIDLVRPSGVSCNLQNPLESIAWTPIPEPDFEPSWIRAPYPHPVPSTPWSLERSPMQAFPPPTSPEAPRPMWPAIRMSA
jgi:serine/threonine protein kinase